MDAQTICLITNAVQIHCSFSEQCHADAKNRLQALNIYKVTFGRDYIGEFGRLLKMGGDLDALFKDLSEVRFPGCGPLMTFNTGHKLPAHLPQIINEAYMYAIGEAVPFVAEWRKPEPIKRRSSSFDSAPLCDFIEIDDKTTTSPTGESDILTAKRGISMQYHNGRIKLITVEKIHVIHEITITAEVYDSAARVPYRKVFHINGAPTVDELQRAIMNVDDYINKHYMIRYLVNIRIGLDATPAYHDQVAILLDEKVIKFKVNTYPLGALCAYELQCRNYACLFEHGQCGCLGKPNCRLNSAHVLNFHLDKTNTLVNWDSQTCKHVDIQETEYLYYTVL